MFRGLRAAVGLALISGLVGACASGPRETLRTAALFPTLGPTSACRVQRPAQALERGQVVVLRLDGAPVVRRVVGLAGDRVAVRGGVLHVGGESALTAQVRARQTCLWGVSPRCECRVHEERIGDRTVPVQTLLRPRGVFDARCVPAPDAPPTEVPAGHVWVLADNRDAARDSRTLGAVSVEDVEGRVLGCRAAR